MDPPIQEEEPCVVVKIPRKHHHSGSTPAPTTPAPEPVTSSTTATMDEDGTMSIIRPCETNEDLTVAHLVGHVEVQPEDLRFLTGCWVKVVNKLTGKYSSGGMVVSVSDDKTVLNLRIIRSKDHITVDLPSHYVYCKETSPNYQAVVEIAQEREKLRWERKLLQQQKTAVLRKYFFSHLQP